MDKLTERERKLLVYDKNLVPYTKLREVRIKTSLFYRPPTAGKKTPDKWTLHTSHTQTYTPSDWKTEHMILKAHVFLNTSYDRVIRKTNFHNHFSEISFYHQSLVNGILLDTKNLVEITYVEA